MAARRIADRAARLHPSGTRPRCARAWPRCGPGITDHGPRSMRHRLHPGGGTRASTRTLRIISDPRPIPKPRLFCRASRSLARWPRCGQGITDPSPRSMRHRLHPRGRHARKHAALQIISDPRPIPKPRRFCRASRLRDGRVAAREQQIMAQSRCVIVCTPAFEFPRANGANPP